MTQVVLTDKKGNKLGLMDKLNAHKNPGFLHRAISVVLYKRTAKGVEILLQKRAKSKPLWPLNWANTVCTHPLDGESNLDCAVRRLKEEVGIEMKKVQLPELYRFYYQADYSEEYSEHELDTVVVGEYGGGWNLNPEEAADARWISWQALKTEIREQPDIFTPWFLMIIKNKAFRRELGI